MNSAQTDELLHKSLPARTAAAWKVIPLDRNGELIRIAAVEPLAPELAENLQVILQAGIELEPVSEAEFQERFAEIYGAGAGDIDEIAPPAHSPDSDASPVSPDSAMARFVDGLIRRAQGERATDIHIEPYDDEVSVRFRIDGLLQLVNVPASLAAHRMALVSRIKVMAGMNIAERRLPQDGRIRLEGGNAEDLDVRVSTIPTIHGETVDLRLLPRTRLVLGLDQLGMAPDIESRLAALIDRPNGILLVTGPTGHGKSTTLYACLSRLNTPDRKIIAIEDPVEYRLRGVNQIQVHPKIGLTFAAALRSVLRQDPDILMVGEIRDVDTAEIAIRAALTGHLVFSTLHTNDAVDAVTRLVDMGVEPYLVASSVNGVLGQRLIRTLCEACRERRAPACGSCRGSGFRGRTGIFELFEMTDELRAMILARAPAYDIRRRAVATGLRTLVADGRRKIDAGITTTQEVARVAGA